MFQLSKFEIHFDETLVNNLASPDRGSLGSRKFFYNDLTSYKWVVTRVKYWNRRCTTVQTIGFVSEYYSWERYIYSLNICVLL